MLEVGDIALAEWMYVDFNITSHADHSHVKTPNIQFKRG